MTEIKRQICLYMSTLEPVKEALVSYSLIQHFDRDLDNVRDKFQDAWTQEAEFSLQSAKVYLFAMAFLPNESRDSDDFALVSGTRWAPFRLLLLSGVTAAVRLIHLFSQMGIADGDVSVAGRLTGDAEITFFPKMYYGRVCEYHFPTLQPHIPSQSLGWFLDYADVATIQFLR